MIIQTTIGLENLKVNEKLFDYYLIQFKNKPTGYELLFFIYSEEKHINAILNEYRLKIIKRRIEEYCDLYCNSGVCVLENSTLIQRTFTFKDKLKYYSDKKYSNLCKLLYQNNLFIEKYSRILYQRICTLLNEGKFDINFLYFGYTDEWIVKELTK